MHDLIQHVKPRCNTEWNVKIDALLLRFKGAVICDSYNNNQNNNQNNQSPYNHQVTTQNHQQSNNHQQGQNHQESESKGRFRLK